MAKGNLTLRMDSELKSQASELFKALGLDLSTATGIFYRQALRCHGLPFEVKI
ncbi:MAG: type II toxin-antitoxin system RelB/DinJ family antitoxin, partial [Lachnospiraceae bacterium]